MQNLSFAASLLPLRCFLLLWEQNSIHLLLAIFVSMILDNRSNVHRSFFIHLQPRFRNSIVFSPINDNNSTITKIFGDNIITLVNTVILWVEMRCTFQIQVMVNIVIIILTRIIIDWERDTFIWIRSIRMTFRARLLFLLRCDLRRDVTFTCLANFLSWVRRCRCFWWWNLPLSLMTTYIAMLLHTAFGINHSIHTF